MYKARGDALTGSKGSEGYLIAETEVSSAGRRRMFSVRCVFPWQALSFLFCQLIDKIPDHIEIFFSAHDMGVIVIGSGDSVKFLGFISVFI